MQNKETKDTCCKYCVFARYEGDTQLGCYAKRIFPLKRAGANILKCYDDEKEFFVIGGKKCFYIRPAEGWLKEDESFEDATIRARAELKIPYHIFILVDKNTIINEVKKSIENLSEQKLLPTRVTVACQPDCKIIKKHLFPIIINRLAKPFGIKWRINEGVEKENWNKAIDRLLQFEKEGYFGAIHAGFTYNNDYFYNLNEAIVDDFFHFSILTPDKKGDGMFIQRAIYNYWRFKGDIAKPVIEKIKESECPHQYPMQKFQG